MTVNIEYVENPAPIKKASVLTDNRELSVEVRERISGDNYIFFMSHYLNYSGTGVNIYRKQEAIQLADAIREMADRLSD